MMAVDRTEWPVPRSQLRSVSPTVIVQTGSLDQAFISRGPEKGTCISNVATQCLANFMLVT